MFSFARRKMLCLAAAALKAHDKLAALGLDRPPRQPLTIQYPAEGKHQI
jgi:hypothetical protein